MGTKAELTLMSKFSNHAFNYYILLPLWVLDADP